MLKMFVYLNMCSKHINANITIDFYAQPGLKPDWVITLRKVKSMNFPWTVSIDLVRLFVPRFL